MVLIRKGKTVTVTHYGVNEDGDRTADGTVTVRGVAVWPSTTTEQVSGQETVSWGLGALLPPGTDVRATDTVTVDGTVYEVDGEPFEPESFFTGSKPGVQVLLRTQTG